MAREEARYSLTAEDRSKAAFDSFNRRFAGTNRVAEAAGRTTTNAFGGIRTLATAAAGGFFAQFISNSLKADDALGHLANRLGTTPELLSSLNFAAEKSGVSANGFGQSLQRMVRRINEVALTGKGEATEALRQLGLNAAELNKLPVDQKLGQIADQMAKVADESTRVRLAMKIFDSEGVANLQMMTEGWAGIAREQARAAEVGAIRTDADIKAAQGAVNAITDMQKAYSSLGRELAVTLAPGIQAVSEQLTHLQTFVKPLGVVISRINSILPSGGGIDGLAKLGAIGEIGNVLSSDTTEQFNTRTRQFAQNNLGGVFDLAATIRKAFGDENAKTIAELRKISANTAEQRTAVAG